MVGFRVGVGVGVPAGCEVLGVSGDGDEVAALEMCTEEAVHPALASTGRVSAANATTASTAGGVAPRRILGARGLRDNATPRG